MRSPTFHRLVARVVHQIDHLPARLIEGKPIPRFKGPPVVEKEKVERKCMSPASSFVCVRACGRTQLLNLLTFFMCYVCPQVMPQEDIGEPHDLQDPYSSKPEHVAHVEDAKPEFRRTFRRASAEEENCDATSRPRASRLSSQQRKRSTPAPDDSDWYNQMKRLQDKMRGE